MGSAAQQIELELALANGLAGQRSSHQRRRLLVACGAATAEVRWRCGGGGGGGAWLVLALALCRFFKPLKCHAGSAANASRCPFKSEMCVRVDDAELQVCVCVCGNIICSYWSRNANPPRNQRATFNSWSSWNQKLSHVPHLLVNLFLVNV